MRSEQEAGPHLAGWCAPLVQAAPINIVCTCAVTAAACDSSDPSQAASTLCTSAMRTPSGRRRLSATFWCIRSDPEHRIPHGVICRVGLSCRMGYRVAWDPLQGLTPLSVFFPHAPTTAHRARDRGAAAYSPETRVPRRAATCYAVLQHVLRDPEQCSRESIPCGVLSTHGAPCSTETDRPALRPHHQRAQRVGGGGSGPA